MSVVLAPHLKGHSVNFNTTENIENTYVGN